MTDISIGYNGSFTSYQGTSGRTTISKNGAANASGTITNVSLYFDSDGTGVKVGIFYGSGNAFTCRSVANIGTVTAGSWKNFSVNLSVEIGDYIGVYFTGGALKLGSGSTNNRIYYGADVTSGGTYTYTDWGDYSIAVYGTGATATPSIFNGLQTIPHSTTKYSNNPIELLNLANRMRIGISASTYHNYIGV